MVLGDLLFDVPDAGSRCAQLMVAHPQRQPMGAEIYHVRERDGQDDPESKTRFHFDLPAALSRNCREWCAISFHENCRAQARAAVPIVSRNDRSPSKHAILFCNASTSPWDTRIPVSPSRTDSRNPGESLATVGVPQAAASMTPRPHPSMVDVWAPIQAICMSSFLRASLTNPQNSTDFSAPRDATWVRNSFS